MNFSDATSLDVYFGNLYANILHDRPLDEAASPKNVALRVQLVYGKGKTKALPGGNELLRFGRWTEELMQQHRDHLER